MSDTSRSMAGSAPYRTRFVQVTDGHVTAVPLSVGKHVELAKQDVVSPNRSRSDTGKQISRQL